MSHGTAYGHEAASRRDGAYPAESSRRPAPADPKTRVDRNGFAYRTKFKLWESRAAVRSKPRRVLADERASGKLFFPPELVPVASHPLVAARGDASIADVLLQRLYVYLDF